MPGALIDGILLLGVGAVIPLALGQPRRWAVVTVAVAASLVVPSGLAAAMLATVWLVVAAHGLAGALRIAAASKVEPALLAIVMAPAFACVAAVAFACSRGNVSLFGIGEPIVELTAVHFTYAGVGAVALAGVVARTHRLAGAVAVVVTVSAPPIVALGFLLEHPVPQVGGAVLMATGVFVIAALQLVDVRAAIGAARPLLVVSSLAPWIPMVLAVAWAASLYADVPAMSIPDMVRTHGTLNAVFVVAGLVARTFQGLLHAESSAGEPAVDPIGTVAP
jgi:hypothetical protein